MYIRTYVLPAILRLKCILTHIYCERSTERSTVFLFKLCFLLLFVAVSVRDITATEMTVVFPKRASRDSVILGYSIAYTTEGLEDFVSKGRADSSRPQKMLTNLEEGAKYSITVEPRTHFRYRLEAGHTVQQTLQAGMLYS